MMAGKERLNIMFLASWYPNKAEPQAGNFVQRHAQSVALNCRVCALHVLSLPNKKDFEVETNWVHDVFEVIVYFGKSSKWLPWQKYNRYIKAHEIGYQHILKEFGKIDLVHLNVFMNAGVFALRLNKRFNIPFIITEHWTAFLKVNPYQFNFYERYFIKKIAEAASMICPVSYDLKEAMQDYGLKGPFDVVPNVVDTSIFKISTNRKKNPIKLLHVSTLSDHHKNVSGILRVIRRLQDDREDFKLTLVGNRQGDFHQNNIKRLGINEGTVTITGEYPIEKIAEFMQYHHIFVLFSNFENLPCVIAEAHASGLVVIGTDVGGVSEMLETQNGILIDAKDEEALYQALTKAMNQLSDYNIDAIRTKAVTRYSYHSVADRFLEIYNQVLKS